MDFDASQSRVRQTRAWSFARLVSIVTVAMLVSPVWADESLYQRLGGEKGVQTLVHQLIQRSATDPQTKRSFVKINRPRLEKLLQQQICQLAGGGCKYEGDSMKQSHTGLDITEAEFFGMVEHLRQVCDQQGIDQRSKNELLALLAPMKKDVVSP